MMIDKLLRHTATAARPTARYAHIHNGPVKSGANRIVSRTVKVGG